MARKSEEDIFEINLDSNEANNMKDNVSFASLRSENEAVFEQLENSCQIPDLKRDCRISCRFSQVYFRIQSKYFFSFKIKIFDTEENTTECIIQNAVFDKFEKGVGIDFKVTLQNIGEISLRVSLNIVNAEGVFPIYISEEEGDDKPNEKNNQENSNGTNVRRNPLYGVISNQKLKLVTSQPVPNLNKSFRSIDIHRSFCSACSGHKPCPRSKFRDVTVLPETNELLFYFRIMAPPNILTFERPTLSPRSYNIIHSKMLDQDFLEEVSNNYHFMITTMHESKSSQFVSTPIYVCESLNTLSFGVNFAEEFLNLFFSGITDHLKEKVCEIYDDIDNKHQSEYSWILHPDVDVEFRKCIRKYLRKIDLKHLLRRCNNQGATMLHYASALNLPMFMDLLLDANQKKMDKEKKKSVLSISPVNIADVNGRTPLHYAAITGDRKSVICLLSYGASPSRKDINGNTPLMYARNYSIHTTINSGVGKLLRRWDNSRDSKILISELSVEKEKLQSQLQEANRLLEAEKLKNAKKVTTKKSSAQSSPPAKVTQNPLFGARSINNNALKKGELKLVNGNPVFLQDAKKEEVKKEEPTKRKKSSEGRKEKQRVEYKLRTTLERERIVKNNALSHLNFVIEEISQRRKVTENTLHALFTVKNILEGSQMVSLESSPFTSKLNSQKNHNNNSNIVSRLESGNAIRKTKSFNHNTEDIIS